MSVKCNICGFEKQFSIVEHLKFNHNLNSKQYKELYPNALVKSKEYSEMNSSQKKIKWSDDGYRQKMSESRQISHNKPEFKKKMSNIVKKRWNKSFVLIPALGLLTKKNLFSLKEEILRFLR